MPRKPRKDSGVSGLFKDCRHENWACPCPWLGRFLDEHRVNLAKWAGVPKSDFNKSKARDALKEMQGQILAGTFNKRSRNAAMQVDSMSFGDALDIHEREHSRKGKTYATYSSGWKKQFGERDLGRLSATGATDIEAWLKRLAEERKWQPVNTHRWWEYGSQFFNWAIKKKKWIKENPCDLTSDRLIGNGDARKRNTRVPEELEAILMRVAPTLPDWQWMRRWLVGALDLGLRRSELLKVQVKHVDYKGWTIRLPITKAGKEQRVYVGTTRLKELLHQRKFLGADAFVFGDENGDCVSVDRFARRWKRWFEAAGISIGLNEGLVWHDLRHEYVSYLLDQGVAIHEVRELARHASIETTMGYATAKEDRLREGAAKLERRSAG